jgi:hypothetical protein
MLKVCMIYMQAANVHLQSDLRSSELMQMLLHLTFGRSVRTSCLHLFFVHRLLGRSCC